MERLNAWVTASTPAHAAALPSRLNDGSSSARCAVKKKSGRTAIAAASATAARYVVSSMWYGAKQ
jgi:hypothetical protein